MKKQEDSRAEKQYLTEAQRKGNLQGLRELKTEVEGESSVQRHDIKEEPASKGRGLQGSVLSTSKVHMSPNGFR